MRKISKYKPVLSKRWLFRVTGKLSHGLEQIADTTLGAVIIVQLPAFTWKDACLGNQ